MVMNDGELKKTKVRFDVFDNDNTDFEWELLMIIKIFLNSLNISCLIFIKLFLQLIYAFFCNFSTTQRARCIHYKPILDAFWMEIMTSITGEWWDLTIILKVIKTNRTLIIMFMCICFEFLFDHTLYYSLLHHF